MTVKIYSTKTCPWCNIAKEYFKAKNIKYDDVDVSEDRDAAEEMIKKSGQRGVPVIEIDNSIIVGFDREKIDSLIVK